MADGTVEQDKYKTQPIKLSDITISSEEYQRLLSHEVAEQAKQHVKNWAGWSIGILLFALAALGWIGYKSLDPLVRQAMQPYMDNARDQLSNLKTAAGIANEAAESARSATRKATEKAEEIQEVINKLRGQAQNLQLSFDTLNQKIEATQITSIEASSRDIENVRNNILRLENLVTDLGKQDSQNSKMLIEYKKIADEQRKKVEEDRSRIARNSTFSVAVLYKFFLSTEQRTVASLLGRDGFIPIFIPYQSYESAVLITVGEKKDDPFSLTTKPPPPRTPKIVYYNAAYEAKAREVQRLIKSVVNIDTVELAPSYSRPLSPYLSSLNWEIEISF